MEKDFNLLWRYWKNINVIIRTFNFCDYNFLTGHESSKEEQIRTNVQFSILFMSNKMYIGMLQGMIKQPREINYL